MRLALGQPVHISTEVRDQATNLTDPDTIVLTVHKPDATLLTYATPTRDSVGKYHQDVPAADLTALGHYSFAWLTTGPAAGVSPPGNFDIFDPFEVAVLPLQDAKDALNIEQADASNDDEIAGMVATIESALERMTGGPLVTTSVTERVKVTRNYRSLVLRARPVVALTSVTDVASGAALDISDIEIDKNAGIVRRKLELPFFSWGPYYTVVYTAGWGTSLPAAFNLAARIILQHLWEIQQGPASRPTMGAPEMTRVYRDTGEGFAIPNRALEVLAPYTNQVSL